MDSFDGGKEEGLHSEHKLQYLVDLKIGIGEGGSGRRGKVAR